MDEYKRLLILQGTLENLKGEETPSEIMRDNIIPLQKWLDKRILELEENRK